MGERCVHMFRCSSELDQVVYGCDAPLGRPRQEDHLRLRPARYIQCDLVLEANNFVWCA